MSAVVLDCREVLDKILRRCAEQLRDADKPEATLAIVMVGDNPASRIYINSKMKRAQTVGLMPKLVELPAQTTQRELEDTLTSLSNDAAVYGIILQLPVPAPLQANAAVEKIPPHKDVDGLTSHNQGALLRGESSIIPCTPLGVMRLLEHFNIPTQGKRAVIVGRSTLVGLPLMLLLSRKNTDATVTICHSRTENLAAVCREADILISAVGVAGLITASHIKPGATVIDVGVTRTADGIRGDVRFDEAAEVAGHITPMPGGTGLLTVACLIENTVRQVLTAQQL